MIGKALLVCGVALVLAVPAGAAGSTKAVGAVTKGKFRAVVTARKTSGGAAPTAAASVAVYERAGSGWRHTRTQPLPGTYFWKTLTAPHAVCRLHVANASLTVSLLVTPSIGCSPAKTVQLR